MVWIVRQAVAAPAAAALLALVALPGCEPGTVAQLVASTAEGTSSALTARRAYDDPIIFRVKPPLAIDVQAFAGDVTINADETVDEVVIRVRRRAVHGATRSIEATAALNEIAYDIDIVPGALGPVLEVRTSTTHPEPHFLRADITIDVPEVDGVRVHTNNGTVVVRNIQGTLDIVTSDGDVRVMTPHAMLEPVQIINHAGDIDYRIRAESTARFDAEALRGEVRQHAPTGDMLIKAGTDRDTLNATLNDGENPVVLRAADGTIRIAVVPEPTRVGHFIF